jgi:transcriptional regulator GlxA family with amidase domain
MNISIVTFEGFTDLDVFLPWDLLNRVKDRGWTVRLVGDAREHRSLAGLVIPMHGDAEEANVADVVLFASGPETRRKCADATYLSRFHLDPERQLIGSMCSGALILAGLGLLEGREATTYPTARLQLTHMGVQVVDRPFVRHGNIATAAGCLAAIDLSAWVITEKAGATACDEVLASVRPVGSA